MQIRTDLFDQIAHDLIIDDPTETNDLLAQVFSQDRPLGRELESALCARIEQAMRSAFVAGFRCAQDPSLLLFQPSTDDDEIAIREVVC